MTRLRTFFLLGFIAAATIIAAPAFITGTALAADALTQGPKAGKMIPHRLGAPDQTGRQQTFSSLKRERGLILLFTRSLDW